MTLTTALLFVAFYIALLTAYDDLNRAKGRGR